MAARAGPVNVLFLCTHNSARSILAEAVLNHIGGGRFRAYSAGSSPRPNQQPNPLGLAALAEAGIPTAGLCSKSWHAFAGPQAPAMDLVITVCDSAAGETCPVWPGHPATAHWGYADPSAGAAPDAVKLAAFRRTLAAIRERLERLCALPEEQLRPDVLQATARRLATA
ncbi:MAG: arsenate reductase ArsC [Burkholderiales bacterium]|nr:arsenate reductase ArsC [Burkholderiales bacterium]